MTRKDTDHQSYIGSLRKAEQSRCNINPSQYKIHTILQSSSRWPKLIYGFLVFLNPLRKVKFKFTSWANCLVWLFWMREICLRDFFSSRWLHKLGCGVTSVGSMMSDVTPLDLLVKIKVLLSLPREFYSTEWRNNTWVGVCIYYLVGYACPRSRLPRSGTKISAFHDCLPKAFECSAQAQMVMLLWLAWLALPWKLRLRTYWPMYIDKFTLFHLYTKRTDPSQK